MESSLGTSKKKQVRGKAQLNSRQIGNVQRRKDEEKRFILEKNWN